jgi:type I restriction enzyme, S subunit
MTHQPYPDYKDSGLQWLDVIPAHWTAIRFKFNFELQKRPVEQGMGVVTAFRDGQVTLRSNRRTGGFTEADKEIGYQGVEPGDLVIHAMDAFAGAIGVSDSRGKSTPVYSVCKAHSNIDAMYFAYVLRHLARVGYIESLAKGIRERSTDFRWADARNVWVPLPPFQEQRHIVDFLERETGDIDAFIADQEELIRLLHERRAATITRAVTKGLDPNVSMKDSGVDWVGQVPAHWSVNPVKHFTLKITDGAHISPKTEGGLFDFVSTRDVSDRGIDFEGALKTSPETYAYMVKTGCRPQDGDVLFSKDGTVGRTVVVHGNHDFVVASSLIIIRPDLNRVEPTFLDFLCRSSTVQEQVRSFVKGAGLPRLSIANLLRVIGAFPPLHEQRLISEYLIRETSDIDAAIDDAQEAVALSKERRAAVISASVTGKIDVREHVRVEGEPVGVA